MLQLCEAMEHMHSKLLHRDIKSDNILLTEVNHKYHPMLIDFGKAIPLSDAPSKQKCLSATEQEEYRKKQQKCGARGVRQVTSGVTGLWQPSVIATLLFDPSILALPIIAMQKSPSAGLFTHRKALQELNLLQTVQQVTSLPSQPEAKTSADLLSMMTCSMDWESSLWRQLLEKLFISLCRRVISSCRLYCLQVHYSYIIQ